ncbi:MAG: hypothetical protein C5B52_08565 [Bacteroidetes bacterium]|nr:MAG: hypothetical protein C5B52_08565 [Bacteroidota bacterium]
MRLLTTLTLLTISLSAIGQKSYVDTENKYTDSSGKGIIIQNSLPKGGGYLDSARKIGYTDPTGKNYSYVIFWSRVINQTDAAIQVSINFAADPLAIFPTSDSYIKLFLDPDTMNSDKESMGDYGITGLKNFLDTSYNKSTSLQRTINAKEEYSFYVVALIYQARGTARAAFTLKEQGLYYRIRIGFPSGIIPCGKIVFKK